MHNILMHPSNTRLIAALDSGLIVGTPLTATDVRNAAAIYGKCIHCMAGKITRPSYSSSSTTLPAQRVGSILHCDLYGFSETTIAGNKYFLLCVDEFSGYLSFIVLKSKSSPSICEGFKKLIMHYRSHKHTVVMIHADSENNLSSCETYLNSEGIQLQSVPPYQHEQRMERYVRTIKDRCRSTLDSLPYDLPTELYAELIYAVVQWMNDMPNSLHRSAISPRVLVQGTKLDVTQRCMVPFGTLAMFHVAGKERSGEEKLLPRSELGIVLGPAARSHSAVRCYLFSHQGVFVRNHFNVVDRLPFDFEWKLKNPLESPMNKFLTRTFQKVAATIKVPTTALRNSIAQSDEHRVNVDQSLTDRVEEGRTIATDVNEQINITSSSAASSLPRDENVGGATSTLPDSLNESRSPSKKRIKFADSSTELTSASAEAVVTPTDTVQSHSTDEHLRRSSRERKRSWQDGPVKLRDDMETAFRLTIKDALLGPYGSQTKDAILDEIRNMLDYQVGHYVHYEDIPAEHRGNFLGSFMFPKHKFKPNGDYDKTKVRLVGDGSSQEGHLYDVVSSSTVALTSVFLLLNLATFLQARVVTYDIKGAFLNAKFKKGDPPIYLVIRREIAELWVMLDPSARPFITDRGELLILLDKYIYGLKQSPLKFQEDLHGMLKEIGYTQSLHDECIFTKQTEHGISVLSTHVDDILQISTSDILVESLRYHLIERYTHVTYHAKADSYLGMTIEQSEDRRVIKLSQRHLTNTIVEKCSREGTRPVNTPAASNLFEVNVDDELLADNKSFLSIVMSLMYLARLTRPDLLLPVTFLASRGHAPTKGDLVKLNRVIKYLAGTMDKGLTIQCTDPSLRCYCDASYGIHSDGRSHSGYFFCYGSNSSFVHARSYKQ